MYEKCFIIIHPVIALCTKAARKLMPPIVLCWPNKAEADAGGMTVEFESSTNILLCVAAMQTRQ